MLTDRRFAVLCCGLLVAILFAGCAKAPPNLLPGDLAAFKADQAQVAIGTAQHAAIELNKIQACPSGPTSCHPFLSDANTRMVISVVRDGVNVLQAVPDGWQATSRKVIDTISQRLDAAGKTTFAAYLAAVTAVIDAIQ